MLSFKFTQLCDLNTSPSLNGTRQTVARRANSICYENEFAFIVIEKHTGKYMPGCAILIANGKKKSRSPQLHLNAIRARNSCQKFCAIVRESDRDNNRHVVVVELTLEKYSKTSTSTYVDACVE